MDLTKEQQDVLSAQGKIIVSASAGSGKTFVMIKRIIDLILKGNDVDKMIAVTFTKKAANQMREKIQKAMIERINSGASLEERNRLKEQLALLPMAEISTIHSFCTGLLRRHFFQIGIDGNFEVLDGEDSEGKELRAQAMEQVFSELYEDADPDFMELLSVYYKKKKDEGFKKIVGSLYEKVRVRDDYLDLLSSNAADPESLLKNIEQDLMRQLKDECSYITNRLFDLEDELRALNNVKTVERIEEMTSLLGGMSELKDFFSACNYLQNHPLTIRKETVRQDKKILEKLELGEALTPSEEEKVRNAKRLESLISKTDYYKKEVLGKLTKNLENYSSKEKELSYLTLAQKKATQLNKLLLKYDEAYSKLKSERSKLDYNDLEHFTLKLLKSEAVAQELREKYDYVFVDEYQDVNPTQEKIISLISGKNVFLVGDVKQAIYGFRGSKSEYFVKKEGEFSALECGHALSLSANFRSASDILKYVNEVFSKAMTQVTCGIEYASKPMQGGTKYGAEQGRVAVHFLAEEEKSESKKRGVYSVQQEYKKQAEEKKDPLSRMVFDIIQEELSSFRFDPDQGKMVPITYKDIAVLSRKREGDVSKVVTYLAANNIPVSSETKVNLLDFSEVRQLLDILSYIDNPEQDVPLCSALLSNMGGCSHDDLSSIRIFGADKKNGFPLLGKVVRQGTNRPALGKINRLL